MRIPEHSSAARNPRSRGLILYKKKMHFKILKTIAASGFLTV